LINPDGLFSLGVFF